MFISYRQVGIGSRCNFRCADCGYKGKNRRAATREQIKKRLDKIPPGENIEFVGGEPFIRKDILDIMEAAGGRYARVKYTTNGSVFSDGGLLANAIERGLNILYIKFHSVDPEIHRSATGTDTLHHVLKGLDNIRESLSAFDNSVERFEGRKFAVIVRVAVNPLTSPGLLQTVDYVSRMNFARVILDCGKAGVISGELTDVIKRSIVVSLDNGTWPVTLGLPPCAMPGAEEHVGECFRLEKNLPGYALAPEVCGRCEIAGVCAGAPVGTACKPELKPIKNMDRTEKIRDLIKIYTHLDWGK